MWALIEKECREHRHLIVGLLVAAPLLSLGLKWGIIGWEKTEPVHSMKAVIPILTLLYVLVVAADLIAADAVSGRFGFLLALPVRAGQVFAAKAVFLFGSAALFIVYLLLVEVVLLALGGKVMADLFAADTLKWSYWLVPSAVAGAGTMAFSALVSRGLAAAFLALLAIVGLAFAVAPLHRLILDLAPGTAAFQVFCMLAAVGFLLASLAASTVGRIHLGSRLRRFAVAGAAFLLVALPTAAWAAARVHRHFHIEPHQEDILVSQVIAVDPAAEWAFVVVRRPGFGRPNALRTPYSVWAVDLHSGRVRDLTEVGYPQLALDCWSAGPGRVVLHRDEDPMRFRPDRWLRVDYDLERGEIVSSGWTAPGTVMPYCSRRAGSVVTGFVYDQETRKSTPVAVLDGQEPLELPGNGEYPGQQATRNWGIAFRDCGREGTRYGLLMMDSGKRRTISAWPTLLPSSPQGFGWAVNTNGDPGQRNCRIERIPLDGSPMELVRAGRGTALSNPLCSHAIACIDGETWWIDADADAPVALQSVQFTDPEPYFNWSVDGSVCIASDGASAYRLEVAAEGPRIRRLPVPSVHVTAHHPCYSWFDGERWLGPSEDFQRLLLIGPDGSTRQILPVPEGER
jgi:hypothetical protein